MTLAQLLAEIQSGPMAAELAPLAASGNDAGVAAALNRGDRTYRRPVDIVDLGGVCAGVGITGRVKAMLRIDVGANYAPPGATVTPMTLAILSYLNTFMTIVETNYRLTTADLDDARTGPILDTLALVGILSAPVRGYLLTLQNDTRSRAAELGWGGVTQDAVHAARGANS